MKKTLIGILAVGTLVTGAQATCASYGCTGEVTRLQVTQAGNVQVGIAGTAASMNCTPVANSFSEINLATAGGNAIYSALLTAKTTGKPILVRIVEGSSNCQIAYVNPQ